MTNTITSIVALLALSSLPAAAANVVYDPGFELTASGQLPDSGGFKIWSSFTETPANSVVQSSIVHGGSQALALDAANGGNFTIVYQNTGDNVPTIAIENTTWAWSFWVYTAATNSDTFNYEFFPSNALNQNQPGAAGSIMASSLIPNTWTQIGGTFSTGDFALDPDRMKINFLSFPGAGTSTFYIDDVSLESIPEPTTALSALLGVGLLARRRRA